MKPLSILLALAASAAACGPADRQNSALCGLTMMASANRVLDQLPNPLAVLSEPPEELTQGYVQTRVVGYGTSRSIAAVSGDSITLRFEGEGLPAVPGFGVALVDDSSEVFRGVLVFEAAPPDYPVLGTIAGTSATSIPLFGLRIHWSSVNSEQCPLFDLPDSLLS